MHMKYDYYNHTNVFKTGYNIQLGVSSGYIRTVYVSQNCNDIHDFIPAIETYFEQYGKYPKMVPADAGYGSFDNYSWCEEHGIELMMKYSGQNQAQQKLTDQIRFRSWAFSRTEEGVPVCPAGHVMEWKRELMMKYSGQNQAQQKLTDQIRFRSWAFSRTEEGVPVCPAGHVMEWKRTGVSNAGLYQRKTDYYGCSRTRSSRRLQTKTGSDPGLSAVPKRVCQTVLPLMSWNGNGQAYRMQDFISGRQITMDAAIARSVRFAADAQRQ